MKFAGVIVVALLVTASASADVPATGWARKDMVAAVKAIKYPKPGARKISCRGLGTPDTTGRYTAFRCTTTYTHHRRRAFVIGGDGEGGWLCAARTLAGCKLLTHGFVTNGEVAKDSSLSAAADIAARGYMGNHYGSYQPTGFCKQQSAATWSCGFTTATVTLTMRHTTTGYVISGTT